MPAGLGSHRLDRAYTISTLFLLVATCATILALFVPLARSAFSDRNANTNWQIWFLSGGGIFGASIGMFVGLFNYSRLRAVMQGILLGAVLGMVSGPLVFISANELTSVLLMAIIGSTLIVGLALGIRLRQGDWKKQEPKKPPILPPKQAKPHPLDPDP